MKLFRNRVFVIFLCVVVVLGSTCVSASLHLRRQSQELSRLFYDGLNREESISSAISRLCHAGSDMSLIADNYSIDTEPVKNLSSELQAMLSSCSDDISTIYKRYSSYMFELKKLRENLLSLELSQRHIQMINSCAEIMDDAEKAITDSCYNSRITALQKSFNSFPEVIFTSLFDINTPAKFS